MKFPKTALVPNNPKTSILFSFSLSLSLSLKFPSENSAERKSERKAMNTMHYAEVSTTAGAASKLEEVDIESGELLYPGISKGENQLRWGFIRKVYGILSAQLLLTTAISFVTVLYTPVNDLLKGSPGLLMFFAFLPLVLLWPLHVYQQRHPLNFVFLGLFTLSLSVTVGVAVANTDGAIVLEALILTSGVVASLTAYTFWASKKGKDFSFLGPVLFTGLMVLLLTSFMQMFFPLGPTSNAVIGAAGAILFSGYIVYDTENLIKRFTYDEYIWASITLYLDILNLFLTILRMLRQSDS